MLSYRGEMENQNAMSRWRVGTKIPINVYEGDRAVCQCHTAEDARLLVRGMNAQEAAKEYGDNMLSYRGLLVDTEGRYERPVQSFFQRTSQIGPWAKEVLARATGKDAYVVVYRVTELEVGVIKRSDHDTRAISDIQPAVEETDKPVDGRAGGGAE